MPEGLSKADVRRLSERLRAADESDPADIALLGHVLPRFNSAMVEVQTRLQSIGLEATTRLKTSGTIIEKLKRSPHLHLGNIRDLAGARVVQRMTLDEQDAAAKQILEMWPNARLIDRRADPSFGYRAVHIVVTIEGCPVEIQLRTQLQDAWAQTTEFFGDVWGRAIRYGGQPDDPDTPDGPEGLTRAQTMARWLQSSDVLHKMAQDENELARLRSQGELSEEDQVRAQGLESSLLNTEEARRTAKELGALAKEGTVRLRELRAAGDNPFQAGRVDP